METQVTSVTMIPFMSIKLICSMASVWIDVICCTLYYYFDVITEVTGHTETKRRPGGRCETSK